MRAQTFCHLNDDMIIANAERAIGKNLDRYMPIADMPGHTCRLDQTMAAQISDSFVGGDHPDEAAIVQQQSISVCQSNGLIEIELNSPIIIGAQPDPTAMTIVIIERHAGGFLIRWPIARFENTCGATNHQNRKYRCAIGSSTAGSQVSNSPSARTS